MKRSRLYLLLTLAAALAAVCGVTPPPEWF